MLVTLNRVLEYAEANNQAIGAFNACNYEGIQAIIRAAEELNQPVILQYADAHEGYITLDEIGPIMVMMVSPGAVSPSEARKPAGAAAAPKEISISIAC